MTVSANDDDQRRSVSKALQLLTNGLGLYDSKLVEWLSGKANTLVSIWEIDLSADPAGIRKTIAANITHLVNQIEPRTANQQGTVDQRRDQYQNAVLAQFNALEDAEFNRKDLTRRRRRLENPRLGFTAIKTTVAQNDLKHAIGCMADMLVPATGITGPTQPEPPESLPTASDGDDNHTAGAASDTPFDSRQTVPIKAALIAGSTVAVLAVTATVVVSNLSADPDEPGATANRSTATAVPASRDFPPVAIDGVQGMSRDEGALNYAFDTPLNLDAGGLRGLNRAVNAVRSDRGEEWYQEHGAIPIEYGRTKITLRGNWRVPVHITEMRALKDCGSPVSETILQQYSQGGNSPNLQLGIDLDSQEPIVRESARVASEGLAFRGPAYFDENSIELYPGESTTVVLGAKTTKFGCSFRLRMTVTTPRGKFYQDIDNGGRPFRVTASSPSPDAAEHPFAGYQSAYQQNADFTWRSVDPATYNGI